ncbi:MAG: CoA-binding protein [Deltaproteobacteria bacterium]|uniref:CoA-binding protein n=1 Tax=Candidatus Zymogenus saltonus TaxID=2844893 RepID=A0A9D8PJR7_9DELT|nr:CoA-binding protein [Candidatus Zymogenus saltonus]
MKDNIEQKGGGRGIKEKGERFKRLDRIIHPKSLAIIGATPNPGKYGWLYQSAITAIGFKGNLYPISDKADEILGVKAYRSLSDLPEVPDLAVIVIPAPYVPEALKEALDAGIAGAVIMSAGFSEEGEEGAALEDEIRSIADGRIRVIGPNCFGTYSPKVGVTIIPGSGFSTEPGPVGFFAQSGGLTADLCQLAKGSGVRFSAAVSYGNGVDVNEVDLLEYFAEDKDTKVIAAYLEGVLDGERFFELLRDVTPKKPVIIWKGGMTEAGGRAVMSHTASMGGSRMVWDAIFRQTGAVRASGLEDMVDAMSAFCNIYPRSYPMSNSGGGGNIAMMGGGGALCVEAADLAEDMGLDIPTFPANVQDEIRKNLPPKGSNPKNPVDTGNPMIPPAVMTGFLETAARVDGIDYLILIQILFHIQMLFKKLSGDDSTPLSNFAFYPELSKGVKGVIEKYGKPVVCVLPRTSTTESDEDMELELEWRRARSAFIDAGAAVFPTMERAMTAISRVARYRSCLGAKGR